MYTSKWYEFIIIYIYYYYSYRLQLPWNAIHNAPERNSIDWAYNFIPTRPAWLCLSLCFSLCFSDCTQDCASACAPDSGHDCASACAFDCAHDCALTCAPWVAVSASMWWASAYRPLAALRTGLWLCQWEWPSPILWQGKSKSKSKKTLFKVGQCKQHNISSHLKCVLVADKSMHISKVQ